MFLLQFLLHLNMLILSFFHYIVFAPVLSSISLSCVFLSFFLLYGILYILQSSVEHSYISYFTHFSPKFFLYCSEVSWDSRFQGLVAEVNRSTRLYFCFVLITFIQACKYFYMDITCFLDCFFCFFFLHWYWEVFQLFRLNCS